VHGRPWARCYLGAFLFSKLLAAQTLFGSGFYLAFLRWCFPPRHHLFFLTTPPKGAFRRAKHDPRLKRIVFSPIVHPNLDLFLSALGPPVSFHFHPPFLPVFFNLNFFLLSVKLFQKSPFVLFGLPCNPDLHYLAGLDEARPRHFLFPSLSARSPNFFFSSLQSSNRLYLTDRVKSHPNLLALPVCSPREDPSCVLRCHVFRFEFFFPHP